MAALMAGLVPSVFQANSGMRKKVFTVLAFVTLCGCAMAQGNWLTIVGHPQVDDSQDYAQLNPAGILREKGLVTIPIRVSRALERTSQDGIKFRSYVGVAEVDCVKQTARFLRASFYRQPNFQGEPYLAKDFGTQIRPVAFRDMPGNHTQQTVRAACIATR